ncbi:hypothetical protein TcWFU_006437 [Taenia crassiceps]|uniref:Uncharacterized protein n=1 Tax=Taenia crassiceps TaxID=6207 RepID=A0ABR4Q5V4_9CEST
MENSTGHLHTTCSSRLEKKFPYAGYIFGDSNKQSSDLNQHQRDGEPNIRTNAGVRNVQNTTSDEGSRTELANSVRYSGFALGGIAPEESAPNKQNFMLQGSALNSPGSMGSTNPDVGGTSSPAEALLQPQQEDSLHTPNKPVLWKNSPQNAPLRESKARHATHSCTPRQLFHLEKH